MNPKHLFSFTANNEEEELAAEEEEKEALSLQQRMLSHLDQEDFDLFEATEARSFQLYSI